MYVQKPYNVHMSSAIVNIRTDSGLKSAAQKVAESLGFNLSTLINAYLKNLVKTKTIYYSQAEEPTEYLRGTIRQAEEDLKLSKTYSFKSTGDATRWLKKQI